MAISNDRLKLRCPTAWREACQQHLAELYGFVFRLVRGEQTSAEDLVQEIWLEAIERIDGFDPSRGELRGWLFEIARRRVALHWRKWLIQTRALQDIGGTDSAAIDGEAHDGTLLPEAVLEQLEQAAVVRAALLLLPPDRRDVLLDKYREGLSVDQIAAKTGKSLKAVESLLTRSRQQLRELLQPYFADPAKERASSLPSIGE